MSQWFQWLLKRQRNGPPQLLCQCCMTERQKCCDTRKMYECFNLCGRALTVFYPIYIFNVFFNKLYIKKYGNALCVCVCFSMLLSIGVGSCRNIHSSSLLKPLNVCVLISVSLCVSIYTRQKCGVKPMLCKKILDY